MCANPAMSKASTNVSVRKIFKQKKPAELSTGFIISKNQSVYFTSIIFFVNEISFVTSL